MITSSVRRAVTSLVILGGMTVGAAPIHAQDITPPSDTTSAGGYWNITPPTTTTTLPPRVQAPTTTTIPSTPPTTAPAIPNPPRTTAPPAIPNPPRDTTPTNTQPQQQPETTLPLQPPTGTQPPPLQDAEDCAPVVGCMPTPTIVKGPPITTPDLPIPDEAAPTLPTDFASNDARALRDGLRTYRQARLVEMADTGASCLTLSCVNEIEELCASLGQNSGTIEWPDGGYEVFCWERDAAAPAQWAVAMETETAGDDEGELICWETEDGDIACMELTIDSCTGPICDDEAKPAEVDGVRTPGAPTAGDEDGELICWETEDGDIVCMELTIDSCTGPICDDEAKAADVDGIRNPRAPTAAAEESELYCWETESGDIVCIELTIDSICIGSECDEGDEGTAEPTLDVTRDGTPGEGDDDSELICWETEDGEVVCLELTIDSCKGSICDEEAVRVELGLTARTS